MNGLPKVMHLEVETQNSRYRMQFCPATMGIAVFDAEGAVKVIGRAFGVPWEGYSLKVFPLDGSMPMTFSALKSVVHVANSKELSRDEASQYFISLTI